MLSFDSYSVEVLNTNTPYDQKTFEKESIVNIGDLQIGSGYTFNIYTVWEDIRSERFKSLFSFTSKYVSNINRF